MIQFIEFINKVSPICRELHSFRQLLSNQTTLHYYQIFRHLDTSMKGYISTSNLVQTLGLEQTYAKIITGEYSKVVGSLKLIQFKEILNMAEESKKQDTLKQEEVLFVVRAIMELECKYIMESNRVRKQLRKMEVEEVLGIFRQFDNKNLSYINANGIRGFIEKSSLEVPQYLELVIRKEFKYQLISFQDFLEFFRKPDRITGLSMKQKTEQEDNTSKRVRFNFDTIKTPKRKFGMTSKKQQRGSSKSRRSRNVTPQKFRTVSPKRWQDMTLEHEENKQRLFLRFHPDTIQMETKKNFGKYFKLYSVYN